MKRKRGITRRGLGETKLGSRYGLEVPKIPTRSVIQSVMDHVRTLKVLTSDLYLLPRWRPTPFDRMVFVVRDGDRAATVQYWYCTVLAQGA